MAESFFVIHRVETGRRIRRYRKSMHLSQEGLAAVLAGMGVMVSVTSIGNWERGLVEITPNHARALAKVFGCRVYGELVVFHLRDYDGEADQPASFMDLLSRCSLQKERLLFLFFPSGACWFSGGGYGMIGSKDGRGGPRQTCV